MGTFIEVLHHDGFMLSPDSEATLFLTPTEGSNGRRGLSACTDVVGFQGNIWLVNIGNQMLGIDVDL